MPGKSRLLEEISSGSRSSPTRRTKSNRGTGFSKPSPNYPIARAWRQDLIDWSRDIITESFEWDRDRRRHPYALNAAWVAYGYAGIRSNCAFSTEDHIMDFGVEDLDEAAIGLQYAIMAPGRLVPIHESLVFAWVIDTFYENPDRHYAAARFLQQGAYRETLDFP